MKKIHMVLLVPILLCQGCFTLNPPVLQTSPSLLLRSIEAKNTNWYVLSSNVTKDIDTIAVRLSTTDTLFLLDNTFRLLSSGGKLNIQVKRTPAMDNFDQKTYVPSIDSEENIQGREYVTLENQKINSFGAFINIDKIFRENPWCKIIIIDDLSKGYFFTTDKTENFSEVHVDYHQYFLDHYIVAESPEYNKLIKNVSHIAN